MSPDLSCADLHSIDLSWANLARTNLCGANLSGANLTRADLRDGKLVAANLTNADLSFADLGAAQLQHADLSGSNLYLATLNNTDLYGANLTGANLFSAEFFAANLVDTNLTYAQVGQTIFVECDLSEAKGLDAVEHVHPSVIGIETIYRSQGKIPVSFLRGCGVPESFIEYMPSLVAPGAIQFYSCFISYSTKDQEFADRLYADLQNKGVRCWFAPHDVQGGKKLHEQIDDAIRRYERLLLILSPNSMNSKWVKTEIRNARKREVVEKKRVLFPVRLASYDALRDWKLFDADQGEDLATEVREYYIPDFSEWKDHDLYKKEFEKLLRDLRTESSE